MRYPNDTQISKCDFRNFSCFHSTQITIYITWCIWYVKIFGFSNSNRSKQVPVYWYITNNVWTVRSLEIAGTYPTWAHFYLERNQYFYDFDISVVKIISYISFLNTKVITIFAEYFMFTNPHKWFLLKQLPFKLIE